MKRKFVVIILVLITLLMTVFAITACHKGSAVSSQTDGDQPPQPETVVVTFDSVGGSVVVSITLDKGSALTAPANPTKNGYGFVGWFKDSQYQNAWGFTVDLVEQDVTLYAKWSINSYDVTANVNDSSAGTVTGGGSYEYNSPVTLNATTNPGYTWLGWYDGDTKVSDGASLEYTFTMPAEDISYTAKWSINSYDVTANVNDSSAGTVTGGGSYEYNSPVTLNVTTNIGYTWLGWYDGDTKVSDGASLEYTFAMPAEDKTYTAKWSKVTINQNNASAGTITSLDDATYVVGDSVTVTATTNIGYTWLGWYDGDTKVSDGESLEYTFAMPAEDKTYTAKWEVLAEMANFNFNSTGSTCTITGIKDKSVTTITIPNYVTSINSGAFSGCNKLQSISLPFIGGSRKTSADTYQYPLGYIFGTSSYTGGTSTTQRYYGFSSTTDTSDTYYIPTTLISVTVTDSTHIPYGAFYNCGNLTSVTILDSVQSIEGTAFRDCTNLQRVTIGSGVTIFSVSLFNTCNNLESITVSEDNPNYSSQDGILYNKDHTEFVFTPNNISGDVIIPNGITSISGYTFQFCGITSVTIPDSVVSIANNAFYTCNNLSSVIIGSGVTSIGETAFYSCSNIASITVSEDNPNYSTQDGILYNKSKTAFIIVPITLSGDMLIPSTIESIGSYTFQNCSNLISITIPDSVQSIGNYVFKDCTNLQRVTIGSGVTSFNNNMVFNCNNLASITVSGDNPNYSSQDGILYNKGKTEFVYVPKKVSSVVIPATITSIGTQFYNCSGLTNITIPGSVTSIDDYAFYGCSSLTSITISDTVIGSIGNYAFYNCSSLMSVAIGNGVTSIGNYAFYNCNSLTSVTIGNSVTSIGNNAFCMCKSLTSIIIPDSVETIESRVFCDCSKLQSVTFGSGVTKIANNVFQNCNMLSNVTFEDPTNWFMTTNSDYTGGSAINVSGASTNATWFRRTYISYYWYKLVS